MFAILFLVYGLTLQYPEFNQSYFGDLTISTDTYFDSLLPECSCENDCTNQFCDPWKGRSMYSEQNILRNELSCNPGAVTLT